MKASELIAKLEKAIAEHGDLEIQASVRDYYTATGFEAELLQTVEKYYGLNQFRLVCGINSEKEYTEQGSYMKHPKITFRK